MLSPLSLAVSCICIFLCAYFNKFLNFFNFLSVFLPLTGFYGPWPPCSETCTFFCHSLCQKIQNLSNQYRHFKLFSISMGRNKPPGEISQSPRPRPPQPPVTHTVCGPGCRRLVRPHTSGPHSLQNQLHSTWPPYPHSLAGRPRMHSGGEGAHPLAVERACQRRPHLPLCARSVFGAVTKTLHRCYSDLHPWLIFTRFYPSGLS